MHTGSISTKELSYICDSLKNEESIVKLCVHGAVECQNPQLKQFFNHMSHERFQDFGQLMNVLDHNQYS
ncbi:spore coat protein [Chengkuizengella sediminis]|uniref:spore coat protein n=1 Tax=Chengkuizengella sediminis TaxID=1885917 RepID=UPI00138A1F57|nr:spore coat protein [Chengkuizengella sediminis]NDI36473.1 spore coat protein [Chengkuizengella sediminis]